MRTHSFPFLLIVLLMSMLWAYSGSSSSVAGALLTGGRDLAIRQVISPRLPQCLGASEDLVVQLRNVGPHTLDFSSDTLELTALISGSNTGTYQTRLDSGSLIPGTDLDLLISDQVDLSLAGPTHLELVISLASDTFPLNDTLRLLFHVEQSIGSNSSQLDFAGYNGTNLSALFPQWKEGSGASRPDTPSTSRWEASDFLNDPSSILGTSASINLYNDFYVGEWLIGPQVEVDSSSILSYDYGLTQWSLSNPALMGSDDSVNVYLSTDCGQSYQLLKSFTRGDSVGNFLQQDSLSLATWAGQEIQIAFYANDGQVDDPEDYEFFLDNINIRQRVDLDVGITELLSPSDQGCLGNSENLLVRVKNSGLDSLDFQRDSLILQIGISGPLPQNYARVLDSGFLAPQESLDVLVSDSADFSLPGTYEIQAYLEIAGDSIPINDSLKVSRINLASQGKNLPVLDFTLYNGINLATTYPGWAEYRKSPTSFPDPLAAWLARDFLNSPSHPNGNSAYINLFDTLFSEWFLSPKFSVDSFSQLSYTLAMTDFGSTQPSNLGSDDTLGVFVSLDCGLSFQPLRLYTDTSFISNLGQNEVIDLAPFAGEDLIIGFYGSTGQVLDPQDNEIFIDNINIREVLPLDLQALKVSAPSGEVCLSDSESIRLQIKNTGLINLDFSLDTLDLGVFVSGPLPQNFFSRLDSGLLQVGDTLEVEISSQADFDLPGSYEIKAFVSFPGDQVRLNDSLIRTIVKDSSLGNVFGNIDFNNYDGKNLSLLYPGWKEWEGQGQPDFPEAATNWRRDDFANDPSHPFGNAARFNIWQFQESGWLISSLFTADSASILTYDLALTPFLGRTPTQLGSDDSLAIFISTDCGGSFQLARLYDAQSSISHLGQRDSLVLADFAGQELILAFYASSGNLDDGPAFDNNLYLDNIQLNLLAELDVAALKMTQPENFDISCGGPRQAIKFCIRNNGRDSLDFASQALDYALTLTLPDQSQRTYTATLDSGALAPLQNLTIGFRDSLDAVQTGNYTFDFSLNLSGDSVNINDSLRVTRRVAEPVGTQVGPIDFQVFQGNNLGSAYGWQEWKGSGFPAVRDSVGGWSRDIFNNQGQHPNGAAARFNLFGQGAGGWMISPKISANQRTTLFYDIAISPHQQSTKVAALGQDDSVSIMISLDCGKSYFPFLTYTDSLNIPQGGRRDSLDLSSFAGEELILAFYAGPGQMDDSIDVDIFIDNILLGDFYPEDVALKELILPPNFTCGEPGSSASLVLQNLGYRALDEVPLRLEVQSNQGYAETFLDTLRPDSSLEFFAYDTLQMGPINTLDGGNFEVRAYADRSSDLNPNNDSLIGSFELASPLSIRLDSFPPVCPHDSFSLRVSQPRPLGFTYLWSEILNGDTLVLDSGTSISLSAPDTSTTFLVQERQDKLSLGPVDNNIGPGSFFSQEGGLIFDAATNFTLESILIYPANPGNLSIRLKDREGHVIQSRNVQINQAIPQRIDLQWDIARGKEYEISSPFSPTGLFRNMAGASYPYEIPQILSITQTLDGQGEEGYYSFFYDWRISLKSCDPLSGVATVEVLDTTLSSFAASALDRNEVEIRNFSQGEDSVRYYFGDGDSSSQADLTHIYPAPGTYTLRQVAFGPCGNDSSQREVEVTCTLPTAGFNWEVDPADNQGLTVQFNSNAQDADSISYLLAPGTASPLPDFAFAFPDTGIYVVEMQVFNVCGQASFTDTIRVIPVNLETDILFSPPKIFPNPTTGRFVLSTDLHSPSRLRIEVLTARGKSVYTRENNIPGGAYRRIIDLGKKAKGVYVVKISVRGEIFTQRLVIN